MSALGDAQEPWRRFLDTTMSEEWWREREVAPGRFIVMERDAQMLDALRESRDFFEPTPPKITFVFE